MCKVVITDEDGFFKTCIISKETPNELLEHFKFNPDTKIVYLNGKILSRGKMAQPITEKGTVHLVIKNKTVMR